MHLRKLILCSLLAVAARPLALGQQLNISKVLFRNAGAFHQADLEAVAQMHTGSKVTIEEIQAAAQRLVDTGFFDGVNVDSDHVPSALTVTFILKPLPPDQITKPQFGNFVWLTPEELQAAVHQVVPLYNGELPESGTSLDQIDAALQTALAAKGVAGAVVGHEAVLATSANPVHTLWFGVRRPGVMVQSVHLEGVDPALAPEVNRIIGKQRGVPYFDGQTDVGTLGQMLAPYRDAGYLEARMDDVHTSIVATTPRGVSLDVSAKVNAGAVYRVQTIEFADSPLMSSAAFAATAKLHAGDVASRGALLASLAPVDAAYEKQGYADAYVDSATTVDEAAHTVSYQLTVKPGEQYRVRSVNVVGLSPEARAQFNLAWRLNPGDLYDPGYVRSFLRNNTAVGGLSGYAGGFSAASDPQAHAVDLTVKFVPSGGKS